MDFTYSDISKMIDHSLLRPYMSFYDLEEGIELAIDYDVASVCILPYFVEDCVFMLMGTNVIPATTISFPHGCQATVVKISEALKAIDDGARELDLVINTSRAVSEDLYGVGEDIHAIVNLAHKREARVKVIFEIALLTDEQKIELAKLCGDLGADWVKTSTGVGSTGATPEDVRLLRAHAPEKVQIAASGGVKSFDDVLNFRSLGCTRIGTADTRLILDECRKKLGLEEITRV